MSIVVGTAPAHLMEFHLIRHRRLEVCGGKDEWEAEDRTTGPNVVEVPYLLHCPRVGQRPDLNADSCGYFLVSELNKQGVLTRDDQLISLTATEGMDALVGKRVRVSCTVEYLREAYYDGGSC